MHLNAVEYERKVLVILFHDMFEFIFIQILKFGAIKPNGNSTCRQELLLLFVLLF